MAVEVWEELQRIEAEAAQKLEKAKSDAAVLIKNKREASNQLIKDTEEEVETNGEVLLQQTKLQLEKWRSEQQLKIDTELNELVVSTDNKLAKAVKLLIEKVVS